MRFHDDQVPPILLVDDDADFRYLIRHAIHEILGAIPVFEVGSGEEALGYVRCQPPFENQPRPALIFLDIDLPGLSGLHVLQVLKDDSSTRDIPVIMLTAREGIQEEAEAMRSGAAAYCTKKSDLIVLTRTISDAADFWFSMMQASEPEGIS